jgi:hypothetical protein
MANEAPVLLESRERLRLLAADLEAKYVGGRPFFDALDESLRSPYYFTALLERYFDVFPDHPRIALSGDFGRRFARWLRGWSKSFGPPLVFPGDLRHNALPPLPLSLEGETFVFIDDSYYLGRTRAKVQKAIEDAGGRFYGSLVLYDGSRQPPAIESFFRYHPAEGFQE